LGANNILATGIWISKKTGKTSYAQIISLSTLILFSFLLVPKYGAIGAAFSYLAGTLAQSAAYYYFAQNLWPIPFRYIRGHLLVLFVFLFVGSINQMILEMQLLESLVIGVIGLFAIISFVWFVALSQYDKRQLKKFLKV
jgi:O-antigen/teichoic acid export membrane protein